MPPRRRLQIRVTPELLRDHAHREAQSIGKYGWRPTTHSLKQLRASTQDRGAYKILLCAWRRAGFPIIAIRRLAGRI
jgi:hypothetical protein